MRVLFVVQRYGREVAGGAELHCREFATRLSGAGHEVEVLTTRARDYTDWANHYAEGSEKIDGVLVHRLSVATPRDPERFNALNLRIPWGRKPVPLYMQKEWMRAQGPLAAGLERWLADNARRFEVAVFFTYLYYTTWAGLPVASGLLPTVLHPTAHDEPPLHLPIFDQVFRCPHAFAFSTEEEEKLVRETWNVRQPSSVIGVGVDLEVEREEAQFRSQFGLGDEPYLLFLGRVEHSKGSDELFEYFRKYKSRFPGKLKLVMAGQVVIDLPPDDDVFLTGFLADDLKSSAISGSLAVVNPSYFESFSMVLTEAWAHSKPVLVQGFCEVLEGQCLRSGGGIPYRGYLEFETALMELLEHEELRGRLGRSGHDYAERTYSWDKVMDRYTQFLEEASSSLSVGTSSRRD